MFISGLCEFLRGSMPWDSTIYQSLKSLRIFRILQSQRSRNITVSRSWSSKNVTVSRSLRCVRETSRSPKPWMYESPSELEFRGSIDVENSNGKSGVSIMLLQGQLSERLRRWKISLTSEILMTTKVSWVSRILMTLRVPISGSAF